MLFWGDFSLEFRCSLGYYYISVPVDDKHCCEIRRMGSVTGSVKLM